MLRWWYLYKKFYYGVTVIFEKIHGNTVIQNLARPPVDLVIISSISVVDHICWNDKFVKDFG